MTRLVLLALALGTVAVARADEGQVVFETYRCQTCHAVRKLGLEMVRDPNEKLEADDKGPDLSEGAARTAAWVDRFLLREEAGAGGKKHKKKFRGDAKEREALVRWLVTLR